MTVLNCFHDFFFFGEIEMLVAKIELNEEAKVS